MIEILRRMFREIRDRKVFWGRLDSDELRNYDWDKLMDMVDTHPKMITIGIERNNVWDSTHFIREGLHHHLHIQL